MRFPVRLAAASCTLVFVAACSSSTSTSTSSSTTPIIGGTSAATGAVATTSAVTTASTSAATATPTAPATTSAPTVAATVTPTTAVVVTTAPAVTQAPVVTPPPASVPVASAPQTIAPPATAGPTAAPAVGPCRSARLTLSIGESEGAAGTIHVPILFTNSGTATCTLDGHPGVSFVDAGGAQVGPTAARVPGDTPTITLAPGATVHADLAIAQAGFFDVDQCHPVHAPTLKVFPPDETVAKTLSLPTDICTGIPQGQLNIGAVHEGTEGP